MFQQSFAVASFTAEKKTDTETKKNPVPVHLLHVCKLNQPFRKIISLAHVEKELSIYIKSGIRWIGMKGIRE